MKSGCGRVAAGSGTRLGAGLPKAFVELEGATILERSLAAFRGLPGAVELVLVVPADRVEEAGEIAERALAGSGVEVSCAVGGETRQASVGAGIAALATRTGAGAGAGAGVGEGAGAGDAARTATISRVPLLRSFRAMRLFARGKFSPGRDRSRRLRALSRLLRAAAGCGAAA